MRHAQSNAQGQWQQNPCADHTAPHSPLPRLSCVFGHHKTWDALCFALQVRDYEVADATPYAIAVTYDDKNQVCVEWGVQVACTRSNDAYEQDESMLAYLMCPSLTCAQVLFEKNSPFPTVKAMTFMRSAQFDLQVVYSGDTHLPPTMPKQLGTYSVGPFKVCTTQPPCRACPPTPCRASPPEMA